MRFLVWGLVLLGVCLVTFHNGVEAKKNQRSELQVLKQFIKYVNKQQTFFDKVEFRKMIELMAFSQYILRNSFESYTPERQSLTCVVCHAAVNTFINARRGGSTEEQLTSIGIDFCTLLEIQKENVCRGLVELNMPIFIHLMDYVPEFSGESFCAVLLQTEDETLCPNDDERFDWTVEVPAKTLIKTEKSQRSNETFKIVHISDIHYDPAYEAFGTGDCDEPTCCRVGQTKRSTARQRGLYNEESLEGRIHRDSQNQYFIDLDYADTVRQARVQGLSERNTLRNDSVRAGYWGDYRHCDTPWWGVEDGIDHIIENHQSYDYVYYTGDTIDHGVWETTEELVAESIIKTTEKFKQAFVGKPVYPVMGNHESQPTNQFASDAVTDPGISTSWLYNLAWEQWKDWLPAEAEITMKKGGYYTVLAQPGFRIIVLNSNLCYRYNWWIQYDPLDAREQLVWLVDVLTLAESNNEQVHILSHIPPGVEDCVAVYTKEYKKIIERFSDTIQAEFNGHTHKDEFKMFYSKGNHEPILTAWNGGSLTAYSNVNPNYRLYDIDSSTFEITDMETWVYNLTEANLTPDQRPRWYLEYTFKEKYNVTSLDPEAMDDLLERFVTVDQDIFVNDYHHYRGKSSDPFHASVCGESCVRGYLKYFFVTELYDNTKFHEMYGKFLTYKKLHPNK